MYRRQIPAITGTPTAGLVVLSSAKYKNPNVDKIDARMIVILLMISSHVYSCWLLY